MITAIPSKVDTSLSFKEMARLGSKALAKQKTVSLNQARAQALNIRIRSTSKNKDDGIKHLLKMYFKEWTEEQLNDGLSELYAIYNEQALTLKMFPIEGKYINQFHKETTGRTLKSIAEMKKTPMSYEEEYARHKKMAADERERERRERENEKN